MFGDDTAEHWTGRPGNDPHGTRVGLIGAALTRRHRVGNDRLRKRHDAAAADTLQAAAEDQHEHAGRSC